MTETANANNYATANAYRPANISRNNFKEKLTIQEIPKETMTKALISYTRGGADIKSSERKTGKINYPYRGKITTIGNKESDEDNNSEEGFESARSEIKSEINSEEDSEDAKREIKIKVEAIKIKNGKKLKPVKGFDQFEVNRVVELNDDNNKNAKPKKRVNYNESKTENKTADKETRVEREIVKVKTRDNDNEVTNVAVEEARTEIKCAEVETRNTDQIAKRKTRIKGNKQDSRLKEIKPRESKKETEIETLDNNEIAEEIKRKENEQISRLQNTQIRDNKNNEIKRVAEKVMRTKIAEANRRNGSNAARKIPAEKNKQNSRWEETQSRECKNETLKCAEEEARIENENTYVETSDTNEIAGEITRVENKQITKPEDVETPVIERNGTENKSRDRKISEKLETDEENDDANSKINEDKYSNDARIEKENITSRENRENNEDNNNARKNERYMSVIHVNVVKRPYIREIKLPYMKEEGDDDIDHKIEYNDRLIYVGDGEYAELEYSDVEFEDDDFENKTEDREINLERGNNKEYNNSNADITYSDSENQIENSDSDRDADEYNNNSIIDSEEDRNDKSEVNNDNDAHNDDIEKDDINYNSELEYEDESNSDRVEDNYDHESDIKYIRNNTVRIVNANTDYSRNANESGEETDQENLNAKCKNIQKINTIRVKKKNKKTKIIKTFEHFEINNVVNMTGDKKKSAKVNKRVNNKINTVAEIETRNTKQIANELKRDNQKQTLQPERIKERELIKRENDISLRKNDEIRDVGKTIDRERANKHYVMNENKNTLIKSAADSCHEREINKNNKSKDRIGEKLRKDLFISTIGPLSKRRMNTY